MRKYFAIALMAVLGAALWAWREPLRLGGLWAAGRAKGCSFSRSLASAQATRDNTAIKDRILAASKEIRKDDAAGLSLWNTPRGQYWITAGSKWDLPWNLAEQERDIYGQDGHGVKPGDIVLDCGANVGVYTRKALEAGAKLVVAIEIAPDNIECLRRNFAPEIAAGRVIVYPKGVWNKDDVLTLNLPENKAAASVVMKPSASREGPKVPLTTIDKLVAELNLERVDFIKMDIEGAEVPALEGARETLKRWRPRMALAAYHKPDDPETIPAMARVAVSDYNVVCGPCADVGSSIRPDVLYFY
ncbi:MAG: FkbM family methyltransferase [bacterium]